MIEGLTVPIRGMIDMGGLNCDGPDRMLGHLLDLHYGRLFEQAFFCSAVSLLLRMSFFCFNSARVSQKHLYLLPPGPEF